MSESQPDPWSLIAFEGFSGLNTQSARPGIKDDEMAWVDGFMPVGDNFLRTLPGPGSPIFYWQNGSIIAWFDFSVIGGVPYCYAFPLDGSIWRININTNAPSQAAPPGTIQLGGPKFAGLSQWGRQYTIIVCTQSNGYFVDDGTTLYLPGQTVPGVGVVPSGIGGQGVETYQGRVWVTNGPYISFSAPQSVIDFSSANGGGTVESFDSFLRTSYTTPLQTNGFLYLLADSSINYIAGVQTSGSPPVTTFTNQNADPEVGTIYGNSVDVLGSNIIFANAWGVHVSYGGRVSKVSSALDGVYQTAGIGWNGFEASAAKAIVYGKRLWGVLIPIINPLSDALENRMFLWDEKRWFTCIPNPSTTTTFVQHLEFNSALSAYGTDGKSIYPLFAQTNTSPKIVQSKLWGRPKGYMYQKASNRPWLLLQYFSPTNPTVLFSTENETFTSNTVAITPSPTDLSSGYKFYTSPPVASTIDGALIGMTITTNAADVALISCAVDAVEAGYRG